MIHKDDLEFMKEQLKDCDIVLMCSSYTDRISNNFFEELVESFRILLKEIESNNEQA